MGNAVARLPEPSLATSPADLEELATGPYILSSFVPVPRIHELVAVAGGPSAIVPLHRPDDAEPAGWYTLDSGTAPWNLARYMQALGRPRPAAALGLAAAPGVPHVTRWFNPPPGAGRAVPIAARVDALHDGRAQAL